MTTWPNYRPKTGPHSNTARWRVRSCDNRRRLKRLGVHVAHEVNRRGLVLRLAIHSTVHTSANVRVHARDRGQPPAPSSPMPVCGRPGKRFWPGVYTPDNTPFYTFLQCTSRRSRSEINPRNLGISRVFRVVYEKVGFVLRNRRLGASDKPASRMFFKGESSSQESLGRPITKSPDPATDSRADPVAGSWRRRMRAGNPMPIRERHD